MQRRFLITLVITLGLLISGCTGVNGESPPDRNEALFMASHSDLDLSQAQQDSFFADPWLWAMCIVCLLGMIALFSDIADSAKWLVILLMLSLWFSLGWAWMEAINNAWPGELTMEFLRSILRGEGLIPDGDINPVTTPSVDSTINTICRNLKDTHYWIGILWMALPLPIAILNIGKKHFAVSGGLIGIWFGFWYARRNVPIMLYQVALDVRAQRADPGTIPIIGDAQAAVTNTFNQLNLQFIVGWWASMFYMYLFIILICGLAAFVIGGLVGKVVVLVRGRVHSNNNNGQNGNGRGGNQPGNPNDPTNPNRNGGNRTSKNKRISKKEAERREREAQQALEADKGKKKPQTDPKAKPKGPNKPVPLPGTQKPVDEDDPAKKPELTTQPQKPKSFKERMRAALIKETKRQGRGAKIAGTILTAMGQPEGALVAGIGEAVERVAVQLETPKQDPQVVIQTREADEALQAFTQGSNPVGEGSSQVQRVTHRVKRTVRRIVDAAVELEQIQSGGNSSPELHTGNQDPAVVTTQSEADASVQLPPGQSTSTRKVRRTKHERIEVATDVQPEIVEKVQQHPVRSNPDQDPIVSQDGNLADQILDGIGGE